MDKIPLTYKFIRKVGAGASSTCYIVKCNRYLTDGKNSEYVAKVVKKSHEKYFWSELKVLKSIEHPNIVKYINCNKKKRILFLELGRPLWNYCDKIVKKKLVYKIIYQLTSAIKYLHNLKIIHRDIKLENLLLVNGHIKICDMAFCTTSNPATVKGTPLYMAPEAFIESKLYPESDIWSIGVCYHYLMYKRWPFDANDIKSLAKKLIKLDISCAFIDKVVKQIFVFRNSRLSIEELQTILNCLYS